MNLFFSYLSLASIITCLCLGIFTLSRNIRHPANIGFALGMFALALMESGSIIHRSFPESGLHPLSLNMFFSGQSFVIPAWVIFSSAFARHEYKEIVRRRRLLIAGLFLISAIFVSAANINEFAYEELPVFSDGNHNIYIGEIGRYFYIYMVIGLSFILATLEHTFRSSAGLQRWQIKYIILGTGSILVFLIYLASQVLLFSMLESRILPVISAVVLLASLMMGFFIVRHRLLDADIFVSRQVIYSSVTVLIIGAYLIAVGVVTQGIRYFQLSYDYFLTSLFLFVSVLGLLILFFSASIRRSIQQYIVRNFYKHKYEFRDKWLETTEKISSKDSVEEVGKNLAEMISETMGARSLYLWLYDPISNEFRCKFGQVDERYQRIRKEHPLLNSIRMEKGPFSILAAVAYVKEIKDIFDHTGTALCAPLMAGEDVIGFIMQGEDVSGEPYRVDDFELLRAVTTHAAIRIKNIHLIQDVVSAREMEAFSKMSSFILHDLKNLTNSLSLISQNATKHKDNPDFQRDAMKTVEHTVARMKALIERLSSIPRNIELRKKEISLHDIIEDAIAKIGPTVDRKIVVSSDMRDIPPLNVDSDAICMVFLNLLTNACEALSGGGIIDVSASAGDGSVYITVADNGIGMTKEFMENALFRPFKTNKKSGFGIGLYQCRSIVEAHGGRIEAESEPGRGSRFTVILPAEG